MRVRLECFPCLMQQAVDAIQRVVGDPEAHATVLREVLRVLGTVNPRESPPVIAREVHRALRMHLEEQDPYREIKDQSNAFALELYPELEARILASQDPLSTAVRLAIAGNVIDYGRKRHLSRAAIIETIKHALTAPLDPKAVDEFRQAIKTAKSILYLADNAGEIVFDRLLIERLQIRKVILAVRGAPVINDATLADAEAAGLTEMVRVIGNGTDVPGTALKECSPEFQRVFDSADLVIAKGQGNLETLYGLLKPIYFLLIAKCPLIARELGCDVGDMVIRCPKEDTLGERFVCDEKDSERSERR